jgi:hypothetical protein
MILVPGTPGGPFSVTGGPGTAFGISSKAKNADLAACYIDWRTGQYASELYVAEGGLPAMTFKYTGTSTFTRSVFDAGTRRACSRTPSCRTSTSRHEPLDFMSSESKQLAQQVTPQRYATDIRASTRSSSRGRHWREPGRAPPLDASGLR